MLGNSELYRGTWRLSNRQGKAISALWITICPCFFRRNHSRPYENFVLLIVLSLENWLVHLQYSKFVKCVCSCAEEEREAVKKPTKHNIRMALFWLVQGCKPGDSLVFHFSGHGSQQRNVIGDEMDGMDETICPVDFETQGMIVDDEINTAIVRPLPPGVKLHAIIDACHSGTVLDLPWLYRIE